MFASVAVERAGQAQIGRVNAANSGFGSKKPRNLISGIFAN